MNSLRFFLFLQPVTFVVCVAAFFLSLKRGGSRARWLRGLIICCAGVVAGIFIELSMGNPAAILISGYATYVFIAFMPVCWFLLSLDLSGERSALIKRAVYPVILVPLATSALIWTNPLHHLIWARDHFERIDGLLVHVVDAYGPWFWIHVIWSYLLFIVGSLLLLIEFVHHHRIYRRQASLVFAGVALPLVFNMLYVSRLFGLEIRDYSPLFISVSCILFSLSLTRYGLGRASPLKREHLYNLLDDMIILLDARMHICDINEVCLRRLELSPDEWIGKSIADLVPEYEGSADSALAGFSFCMGPPHRLCREQGLRLECSIRPLIHFRDQTVQGYRLTLSEVAPDRYCIPSLPAQAAPPPSLTRREREVYALLREGLANKEIAARLFVSESTVKSHVHRILAKSGAADRSGLFSQA